MDDEGSAGWAKPVWQCEKFIRLFSKKTVLDLFGGSGSTLIACEKTKRKCFMMELDPHYCDVIVSRFCKFTNTTKVIRNGEEIEWAV
jgi:DNA modification methylase